MTIYGGNFLAEALGIYFTPQPIIDFLREELPMDMRLIYSNPPYTQGQLLLGIDEAA